MRKYADFEHWISFMHHVLLFHFEYRKYFLIQFYAYYVYDDGGDIMMGTAHEYWFGRWVYKISEGHHRCEGGINWEAFLLY